MIKYILAGLITLCAFAVKAQNYTADQIPKDLLPYANSVIRNSEETVEINGPDNVVYHIKSAITVLNKNGDERARVVVYHDKMTQIKNIKGAVYDSFGRLIKKFSEHDFQDQSAIDDFSLFEDMRVKHYLPSVTDYPYTVEYECDLRFKQSLNVESWVPVNGPGIAVEKSSYKLLCKPNVSIRYKELNFDGKVETGTSPDGIKTYTWHTENIKALKSEPFSNEQSLLTTVLVSPEQFSYGDISGSFTDWQQLGKWYYDKLLNGRDILPAETVNTVRDLTKDIADPKLKAKKIYEYMQQRTRYVSVRVGIGGYQPFLASDVDRLNYGDCKALVNYTHALLKAVDIDSYYCVVYSGSHKRSLLNDFASMQGDHIILCIPFKNDTTWAECTNQKMPFGYLSDFTDDRTVLACTPEGGKLIHTPKYDYRDNVRTRKGNLTLNEQGELTGDMISSFKGVMYEDNEELADEPLIEQIKKVKSIYPINNLEVQKFSYKQDKQVHPLATEDLQFSARDYASTEGGKLYFMVNPASRTRPPREIRNRTLPVYINRGNSYQDEIIYNLPKGYKLEKEPLHVSLNKPFGKFSATMEKNGDQLIYKRKLEILDGTYSKDTYQDLVDFYETVADADNYTVVLTKNN